METLRFKRWKFTSDLAPSAVLQLDNACGIYVLEFSNGEQYVGQSVNFLTRLSSHRRKHEDIVAINLCELPSQDLDSAEFEEIQRRRESGIHLRNKTLLSQPLGDSPLDVLVDQQVQAKWLNISPEDEDDVQIGSRGRLAKRRRASVKRFNELSEQPEFQTILDCLASYVAFVIPWPQETEGKTWTVTALPSTNKTALNRRLATLSVNNVEVLFLGLYRESKEEEWWPYTVLNVAHTYEPKSRFADYVFSTDNYRSAGRVKSIQLFGDFVVSELLTHDDICLAARELALGQLRKGTTMFSRFHNDALADAIFERIEDWVEEDN